MNVGHSTFLKKDSNKLKRGGGEPQERVIKEENNAEMNADALSSISE